MRILHIHHALYLPRLITRAMRELGADADFLDFDVKRVKEFTWGSDFDMSAAPWGLPRLALFFARAIKHYDVFHFWAKPYVFPFLFHARVLFGLDLKMIKKAGKKIVWHSDGCFAMTRPSVWKGIDPDFCRICKQTQGDIYAFCSDEYTIRLNKYMQRYADLKISAIKLDFARDAIYLPAPVETELWSPGIKIPEEHRYKEKKAGSIKIYHGVGSSVTGNGVSRGNIKGTEWVIEVVKRLKEEGHNVELMHITSMPNRTLRYYQAQADIVADQFVMGAVGQNGRECMALGKPVLAYMRKEFLDTISEYHGSEELPVLNTDRESLYYNLKRLIEDEGLRRRLGKSSREFAEKWFEPKAAARSYLNAYETL